MTGKPLLDKILVAFNVLVVTGAASLIIYSHTFINPAPLDSEAEFQQLIDSMKDTESAFMHKLPKMVINLASYQAKRLHFLDMEVNLAATSQEALQEIKTNQAEIIDLIIEIGTNKDAEDLSSLSGRILYTEAIRNRINDLLGRPAIKQVYFTRFVVQ